MGALVASELAQRINPLGVVLIGPVHPSPALAGIFDARIKTIEEREFRSIFRMPAQLTSL